MKTAGKFFLAVGILLWCMLFLTGSTLLSSKEEYSKSNQGLLESFVNEVTGVNEQRREMINAFANVNRFLLFGGTLCVIVGIAALIAANGKE